MGEAAETLGVSAGELREEFEFRPTCFDLQNTGSRDVLLEAGVWDAVDVRDWLANHDSFSPRWRGVLGGEAWRPERTWKANI